ncbi:hypothetical protein DFH09DRAFT_1107166 [Mycena vulgaris]|nr:hypothetical protein DFH09DRAFT_1107166 [Mycena vulgaris]
MEILRASPNLVECNFERVEYHSDNHSHAAADVLVFPHMQHLKFGTYPDYASSDYILRHISTPRLQTLSSPGSTIKFEELLQFLRRSSLVLQKLVVGYDEDDLDGDWTDREMEECLSLVPKLTYVELIRPTDTAGEHFFTILAHSPHLVPNLSTISLLIFNPLYGASFYRNLVTALSVRRNQISVVKVECNFSRDLPAESMRVTL